LQASVVEGLSDDWFRAIPQGKKNAEGFSSFCDRVIGGMEPRDVAKPGADLREPGFSQRGETATKAEKRLNHKGPSAA